MIKLIPKYYLLFRNTNILVYEKMVAHLLERPKRVAFVDEFGDRSLMESAGDQQNDVVDHVGITAREIIL